MADDEIPAAQPPRFAGAPPPLTGEPPPLGATLVPESTSGLAPTVAAGLACIFTIVGGIIFLILEKKNRFVRFYAMQSIFLGGAIFLFNIAMGVLRMVFHSVPFLGLALSAILGLTSLAVGVAWVIVYVLQIVKAFSGVEWEIPYIGPIARKQLGPQPI